MAAAPSIRAPAGQWELGEAMLGAGPAVGVRIEVVMVGSSRSVSTERGPALRVGASARRAIADVVRLTGIRLEADVPGPWPPYHRRMPSRLALAVPGRRPRVVDVALAVVTAALSLGAIATGSVHEGSAALTVPVAVVVSGCLLVRSWSPVLAATVAVAAGVVQAAAATSPGTIGALIAYLLLTYTVGSEHDETWALAGGLLTVGGLWAQVALDQGLGDGVDLLFVLLVFGGAWLAGRGVREWRNRATYAEQHRRDLADLAVAHERVRIAREMHDAVANALTVIAVQSDAAEAALERDPALAADPVRRIGVSARTALTDMRHLLAVLRPEPGERAPAKRLADLEALVSSMREAGLPVTAELPGADARCSLAVEHAAYRIAQEGLTNVLKHAGPVPTRLDVSTAGATVEIRVRNAPGAGLADAAEPGRGLVGIRERVSAVGGRVEAGTDAKGGFELRASLPAMADGSPVG
jgi:signal transduction histidine kinase